jgi:hypothetical protein
VADGENLADSRPNLSEEYRIVEPEPLTAGLEAVEGVGERTTP